MTTAFWVDHAYEPALDGDSRYGACVGAALSNPYTVGQAAELAVHAWTLATSPVLAPGYVRWHPRIRSAQLGRSGRDGSLTAAIDLVTGRPAPLQRLRPGLGRAGWRDWPREPSRTAGCCVWYEPSGEDVARGPYLLCQASPRFSIPQVGLASQPAEPGTALLADRCRGIVTALVSSLDAIVSPVLARIDDDGSDQ